MRKHRVGGRLVLAGAGALATAAALAIARSVTEQHGVPATGWDRKNFRNRTVNLVGGPALALAASAASAAGAGSPARAGAALTAGLAAGAVGLYDDVVGARPEQQAKGFHGHVAALRAGRLTSGLVKLAGVGAAGLVAAGLVGRGGRRGSAGLGQVLLGAGVVAGAANLLNLLDLRPGRALKVAVLAGVPLAAGRGGGAAAGVVGAVAAALPDDLRERTMLGDSGANAIGALLGTALITRTGLAGRAAALAVIAGLTAASERVSFTQVIARTPGLREWDALGRERGSAPGRGD